MNNLGLVLLVFAFVVAAIAVRIQQVGAIHLGWFSIALLLASLVFAGIHL